jgi:hypothetical protein
MNFMFNLSEYTTVRERLIEFWKRYPNGRIETEILEWSDHRFIVAARLYRETTDEKPFSTGLANEVITDRGVNKDFALENGATSALGIACGHANIGIDKHKPSREEMSKVVAQKPVKPPVQDLVQAIKAADQETAEQDYWTTPVNEYMKVVDAPQTLEKAIENVASIIGTAEAAEVPQCKHGSMVWKTGHSTKTGKDWAAYQCTALGHSGFEGKCPAVWYELNSAGKWQPQKVRV